MVLSKIIIFCFCLIISGNLFAQNIDEQRISQTASDRDRFLLLFEQETEKISADLKPPVYFTLVPERLPLWLNQIPLSQGNKFYILGISDPGMDEETGFIVAKLRMKMIYSFLYETIVRNMRDLYIRDKRTGYANAFIDYTQFSNDYNFDFSEIKIIESHITKYGETILLGEIDTGIIDKAGCSVSRLKTSAGVLSNARRAGARTEIIGKTNLKITYEPQELNKVIELIYEAHAINRRVNTETRLNGKTISSLPAMNLRYAIEDQGVADSAGAGLMGYSLRNGIWYAYLTAILFELADMAHGHAINISNINEIFDNIAQSLTRELVSSSVSCRQKQIMIRSNNLYLKCGNNNSFIDWAEPDSE